MSSDGEPPRSDQARVCPLAATSAASIITATWAGATPKAATEPARAEPTAPRGSDGGVVAMHAAGTGEVAELDRLDAAGRELAEKARAGSTRAAYHRD